MLTDYLSTSGQGVSQAVDEVLIMGINRHLIADALSTYDPINVLDS